MLGPKERLGEVFRLEPVTADPAMRVPDMALESVVHIGATLDDGEIVTIGTGFLVAHKPSGIDSRAMPSFFIVTAKHVISDLKGLPCSIRINTHDNQAMSEPVSKNIPWYCLPDRSVDVAVLPWVPDHERFKWKAILTYRNFATDNVVKAKRIGIGDEVYTVGLFSPFEGQSRNVPLVRVGHIAMMAENERVNSKDFGPMLVHLIEAHSMEGLSGAPVVVRQTVGIERNPNRSASEPGAYLWGAGDFFLLGLNHGQWKIPAKERKKVDPNAILHSAISAVVPATTII
jgi:hypothetical protein